MVKLTKEDENKLGQILKELNEMKEVLKGGEGSGVKGHKSVNVSSSQKKPRTRNFSPYQGYKRENFTNTASGWGL